MRKLLLSFLLGIAACVTFAFGTVLFETANRPQYKAYASVTSDPIRITVEIRIRTVKDSFDLKDCVGVVKFYSLDDHSFLEQMDFETTNGEDNTSIHLGPTYFDRDGVVPYAVAEITRVTNVHGREKEIWGILLWALGGSSQIGCLILLGLGLWKKGAARKPKPEAQTENERQS